MIVKLKEAVFLRAPGTGQPTKRAAPASLLESLLGKR